MHKITFTIIALSCMSVFQTKAQEVIPLYANAVPNAKQVAMEEKSELGKDGILRISHVTVPTLTVFTPPAGKANGTAVIICPGGAYSILAFSHEGIDVAKQFNEWGVTAFVLKYRLPDDSIMVDKTMGPLQDAQRAIQFGRENRKQWHIQSNRIGIAGFSAGGHLASTAGTHFKQAYIDNPHKTSLRPDFMVLGYPVISFSKELMHAGSRKNLLGAKPTAEQDKFFSNELQVTPQTPPTFLVHAKDDAAVPPGNSLVFAEALKKNGVEATTYLYEKGGHGFGMHNHTSTVKWMDQLHTWMQQHRWVK